MNSKPKKLQENHFFISQFYWNNFLANMHISGGLLPMYVLKLTGLPQS